jgi:predicted RNA-binding Zn-ribbon protein involved in translation (DUF1610 family)
MDALSHITHGKRKFRCPKCGRHRMQAAKTKKVRKKRLPEDRD